MVAEKAADLIRGISPLSPEPVPFYRHAPGPAAGAAATGSEPAVVAS